MSKLNIDEFVKFEIVIHEYFPFPRCYVIKTRNDKGVGVFGIFDYCTGKEYPISPDLNGTNGHFEYKSGEWVFKGTVAYVVSAPV